LPEAGGAFLIGLSTGASAASALLPNGEASRARSGTGGGGRSGTGTACWLGFGGATVTTLTSTTGGGAWIFGRPTSCATNSRRSTPRKTPSANTPAKGSTSSGPVRNSIGLPSFGGVTRAPPISSGRAKGAGASVCSTIVCGEIVKAPMAAIYKIPPTQPSGTSQRRVTGAQRASTCSTNRAK